MRRTFSSFLLVSIASFFATAAVAAGTPIPKAPDIDAKSYILLDFDSGKVLAEKDADQIVEPASITKVMTVYVAFDEVKKGRFKMSDQVTISEKAWRQGIDSTESRMFLDVGS